MLVIYDGACPFCRNFVALMQLRENIQETVSLIDARSDAPEAVDARARYNLDEGMLVIYQDKEYFGADAVALLGDLSTKKTFFSRLTRQLRQPARAKFIYPFFKAGRRAALFLQGKGLIADGRPEIPEKTSRA